MRKQIRYLHCPVNECFCFFFSKFEINVLYNCGVIDKNKSDSLAHCNVCLCFLRSAKKNSLFGN